MQNFRKNLRSELDYNLFTVKELSEKTGISKSTLECYLGQRETLPSVESAVKIAQALNVTVEYLVTGKQQNTTDFEKQYKAYSDILKDLSDIPKEKIGLLRSLIHTVAEDERKKSIN